MATIRSDAEIVEVLATKGMGWLCNPAKFAPSVLVLTRSDGTKRNWQQDIHGVLWWNPLTSHDPIYEIEKRLTEEQQRQYTRRLAESLGVLWHTHPYTESGFQLRHASARTCALALWEVLRDK